MDFDIAIIGGGPAGLTAAIYAVRANKKVRVYEAQSCGGQIIYTTFVDNFPVTPHISGPEFGQKLEAQAEELGADIEFDRVTKINKIDGGFEVVAEDVTITASSVIIATGTQPRKLGLSNEEDYVGHGISYCATCDGGFYRDKVVAVNGGGNTALHEANYLAGICEKVYVIHRRDEFRAEDALVEKVRAKKNVEFVLNANITGLYGEKNLESIKLDNGQEIKLDGLFVSIGREPKVSNLIDGLELNEGFVKAGELCHTNIEGVFVAGDVREKDLRQLVTATSDGAIAATEALKYLK